MLNVSRLPSVRGLALCLFASLAASAAQAQSVPVITPLQRQLDRIDLGVVAAGQITPSVSGTVTDVGQPVSGTPSSSYTLSEKASTTVGVLASLRYVRSPLVGGEVNFSQARFNEDFSSHLTGGAQTKANEYSVGYLAHVPTFFGVKPFAGAGIGTMAFTPTAGGGQGLPKQYRFAYYYNVGVDQPVLSPHVGLRLQFREVFYTAPDFLQNYLTIERWTSTLEPSIGFYIKF